MATNKGFVGLIAILSVLFYLASNGNVGIPEAQNIIKDSEMIAPIDRTLDSSKADCLRRIYLSQIGVKEVGENGGKEVAKYLEYCSLPEGFPWCAASTSWCLGQCGITNPKSAYVPLMFPKDKINYTRGKGSFPTNPDLLVFNLWIEKKGRAGHMGFVDQIHSDNIVTAEGNSKDMFRSIIRPKSTIYQTARYN